MILYFSGTGNSGYAARRIADGLGEPLLCLNDRIRAGDTAPVSTGAVPPALMRSFRHSSGSPSPSAMRRAT